MQDPGDLVTTPEQVPEGGEVDVGYGGPGTLQYSVDFGPWRNVPIDPGTGKGKVTAPGGSQLIVFSDGEGNESIVEVISTSSPCPAPDSPAPSPLQL